MSIILHPDCAFDQIMVKHPRGFEVILVSHGGSIQAFRNSCPHIGVGLDWGDGNCKHGPDHLICAMHGALFEAGTGLCVDGPCQGKNLPRIAVRIEEGRVVCD